jgi:hypothetical protein
MHIADHSVLPFIAYKNKKGNGIMLPRLISIGETGAKK